MFNNSTEIDLSKINTLEEMAELYSFLKLKFEIKEDSILIFDKKGKLIKELKNVKGNEIEILKKRIEIGIGVHNGMVSDNENRKKRIKEHDVKIDDIFVAVKDNKRDINYVEFYQVIGVKKDNITFHQIKGEFIERGYLNGKIYPSENEFIGEPFTKKLYTYNSIKLKGGLFAYKRDDEFLMRGFHFSWY